MKQVVGIATCKTENEAAAVVNAAAAIKGVQVHQEGLDIEVTFTPDDRCTALEEDRTIKRILDILEPVEIHGFSFIS